MSCRGLARRPAAHFVLVRCYGVGPLCSGWAALPIVSTVEFICSYLKELRLAVDEVVHHDNVMVPIIVRTRGNVTGLDHDRRDAGVVKHDAEEGQASIARRRRNETGEDEFAVSVEVLDPRA